MNKVEEYIEQALSEDKEEDKIVGLKNSLGKLNLDYKSKLKDSRFFYLKAYINYHILGANEEVLSLFKKSYELDATNRYALYYIAYCLYDISRYKECSEVLQSIDKSDLMIWRKVKHCELIFCCSIMCEKNGKNIVKKGNDYLNMIKTVDEEDIPYPTEFLIIADKKEIMGLDRIILKIKEEFELKNFI